LKTIQQLTSVKNTLSGLRDKENRGQTMACENIQFGPRRCSGINNTTSMKCNQNKSLF